MSHVQFFEVWKAKTFFFFSQKVFLFSHPFSKDFPWTIIWGVKSKNFFLKKSFSFHTPSQKISHVQLFDLWFIWGVESKNFSTFFQKVFSFSHPCFVGSTTRTVANAADQWKDPFLVSQYFRHRQKNASRQGRLLIPGQAYPDAYRRKERGADTADRVQGGPAHGRGGGRREGGVGCWGSKKREKKREQFWFANCCRHQSCWTSSGLSWRRRRLRRGRRAPQKTSGNSYPTRLCSTRTSKTQTRLDLQNSGSKPSLIFIFYKHFFEWFFLKGSIPNIILTLKL